MKRRNYLLLIGLTGFLGCQTVNRGGLIGTFKIGERAQVGSMIYNVYDTQYLVKIGDGVDARIPKDRFFIVHVSTVNGGGSKSDQSIPTFSLLDDAGESFNELDNGAAVPQWLGFARKVRPAESVTGNIVFDVAPKHYKLRIADDTDQRYAFIDLPLTFGDPSGAISEAPPPAPVPPASPATLSPH